MDRGGESHPANEAHMTTGEIVIVVLVLIAIAHQEWRYRQVTAYLDAIGEMIGEFFDSQKEE
jgi:hypothetical protein